MWVLDPLFGVKSSLKVQISSISPGAPLSGMSEYSCHCLELLLLQWQALTLRSRQTYVYRKTYVKHTAAASKRAAMAGKVSSDILPLHGH